MSNDNINSIGWFLSNRFNIWRFKSSFKIWYPSTLILTCQDLLLGWGDLDSSWLEVRILVFEFEVLAILKALQIIEHEAIEFFKAILKHIYNFKLTFNITMEAGGGNAGGGSSSFDDFNIDKQEYQSVFKVFDKNNTGEISIGQVFELINKFD